MRRLAWSRSMFAATATAAVVSAAIGADTVHRVVKPLMVPALVAGVPRLSPTLGVALAAATVGDVLLLDPDDDDRITAGAGAFAVMQCGYCALLISRSARLTPTQAVPRYAAWAGGATLLAVKSPEVAVRLAGYGLALTTMAVLAADTRPRLAWGGILFTASDALIVFRRIFLRDEGARRLAEAAIIGTYAGAQFLLVEGLSRE